MNQALSNAGFFREARLRAVAALTVAAVLTGPGRAHADQLEKELLKQAPQIIQTLQGKGYKNVGVLKFRVKKGSDAVTDSVGVLNQTLAQRLEIALVLANDNDVKKQLGIVQNASNVAAGLRGASQLTRDGRQALFQGRYPLAWGKQEITPDAFLTGVAEISADLKEMTVGILAFGKGAETLDKVGRFTVATASSTLTEMGESFLLRGAFDDGKIAEAKALETAAKVKDQKEAYPLGDSAAPVSLDIWYDNTRIPFAVKGGKAVIPEPKEGQKVSFVLKRKTTNKAPYGAVLKVNGENTLYRERLPDEQCHKWILYEGEGPITVYGYQINEKKAEAFRVLSRAASKENEIYYGADVGTITLSVFSEKRGKEPPPLLNDDAEDLAALHRGAFPSERPLNLAALKHQLREDAKKSSDRGLMVPGQQIDAGIRRVTFKPEAVPMLSVTITYYKP